ncbi:MAG: sodium/solute symporter, partial [Victivallaceae bacterium]
MNTARLGILDWTLIAAYILLVVGLSIRTKLQKRQNAEEFLVAHKSMNWLVVAVAVFATLFSTISFVSVPGEAYNYGLTLMVAMLAQILVLPLAIWLFLRFFFNAPTFTAYEYLERRFDRKCRITGAAIFITIRLFYTGTVFYAASVIFESLVGWPAPLTIAAIGAVTVLYTVLGGAKAVIFADVLQSVIIFVGIGAILYKILQAAGFDFNGIYSFAQRNNHTFELFAEPSFYRLNVHDRWNFWLILIGVITGPLTTLSCDQLVIQRLLAGKNYQQAKKSMYTNYLISIPMVSMLFGIGLCLYFYYQAGTGRLPEGTRGDQVLGYFISTELPAPLPGLIVTALLAALMSTVAGAVNSLVTVFWKDIALANAPHWGGT